MSPKSSPFSRTPLRFRHGLQEVSYPTNGVLARLILRSLFDQEQYSDIIIQFEGLDDRFDWIRREVKCHKVILCHASKFFNAMCGPAKKSNETERNIIILEDDEQAGRSNEAVLRHIYNFTYAEIREICSIDSFTTATQMDVIVAARKYLLPKLEQEALTVLYSDIQELERNCALLKAQMNYSVLFLTWSITNSTTSSLGAQPETLRSDTWLIYSKTSGFASHLSRRIIKIFWTSSCRLLNEDIGHRNERFGGEGARSMRSGRTSYLL